MNTITVSITDLKRNTSDIINRVAFEKIEAIVKRHGKVVGFIVPPKKEASKTDITQALKETFGAIPNLPDVTKFRRNRKHWSRL